MYGVVLGVAATLAFYGVARSAHLFEEGVEIKDLHDFEQLRVGASKKERPTPGISSTSLISPLCFFITFIFYVLFSIYLAILFLFLFLFPTDQRKARGCIGRSFVAATKKLTLEYYWNPQKHLLFGTVHIYWQTVI